MGGRPPRPLPLSHGQSRDDAASLDGDVDGHGHRRLPCKGSPAIDVRTGAEPPTDAERMPMKPTFFDSPAVKIPV